MSVNPKLSKLATSWKKVTAITGSFSNIPDGDYIAEMKELVLGESKKGRVQVVVDWEIADGEYAGKVQKQFYGLTNDKGEADDKGMGYFKGVCEVIGLDLPEDPNLWQEVMNEFLSQNTSLFEITAKSNGDYVNVYVNSVSEYTKGGGEEATEEVEEAVEEVVEEEVVEEVPEEVQEVVTPVRKTVVKPVAKVVAKPVAKAVVPTRKAVPLNRK